MTRLVERIEVPTGRVDMLGNEEMGVCYCIDSDNYEEARAMALAQYQSELEEAQKAEALAMFMADMLGELGN